MFCDGDLARQQATHRWSRFIYLGTIVGLFAFDLMVNFGPWESLGQYLGIGFGALDAGAFIINLIVFVSVVLILRDLFSHLRGNDRNNLERSEYWTYTLHRRIRLLVWTIALQHAVRGLNLIALTFYDCYQQSSWDLRPRDVPGMVYTLGAVVLAITAKAVVVDLYGIAARHFTRRGYCRACGYDLQGNRDTTACPECGADVRLDHQYQ